LQFIPDEITFNERRLSVTILKGIFGAMCTPFQENGKGIDIPRYQSHIDDLLEAGVHGLVLCSGTGEYAYLTDEEKQTLIQEGVKHINGRCPTIAQTTALSTNECIDKARAAEDSGASAIMVMPPFLEPPSERGVIYHYEAIGV
jgi:dihydrodipicolinate synthase/N-acetylneuraminate lyase